MLLWVLLYFNYSLLTITLFWFCYIIWQYILLNFAINQWLLVNLTSAIFYVHMSIMRIGKIDKEIQGKKVFFFLISTVLLHDKRNLLNKYLLMEYRTNYSICMLLQLQKLFLTYLLCIIYKDSLLQQVILRKKQTSFVNICVCVSIFCFDMLFKNVITYMDFVHC